jgi:hypothetical protein
VGSQALVRVVLRDPEPGSRRPNDGAHLVELDLPHSAVAGEWGDQTAELHLKQVRATGLDGHAVPVLVTVEEDVFEPFAIVELLVDESDRDALAAVTHGAKERENALLAQRRERTPCLSFTWCHGSML